MSIAYDLRPRLRPDLPDGDEPSVGTLRLSASMILTCFSLLMPTFSLLSTPRPLAGTASARSRRSPTRPACLPDSGASVVCLAPLHYRRRITGPVSYYALFQGWLLLSQPPGCLGNPTSFATEHTLGDLSGRSGLFPSCAWNSSPTRRLPHNTYRHSEFG